MWSGRHTISSRLARRRGSRCGAAVVRSALASAESCLYRATLVQAAPGKLLDLIDAYKAFFPTLTASGDEPPLWMRHSQGDRWDLLLLFPMESYVEFYRTGRIARRQRDASSVPQALARLRDLIAWQEAKKTVPAPKP